MKNFWSRSMLLFTLGALFGTLGDLCHVLSYTDGYPLDRAWIYLFAGIPFWVPLLFGTAAFLIGTLYPVVDQLIRNFHPRPGIKNRTRVTVGLASLVILWGLSGFLPLTTGALKDVFMAICALVAWKSLDGSWKGFLMAALTAIIGTSFEIFLVGKSAFFYYPDHANFFGVPSWLPWLYIVVGVTVGNLGVFLVKSNSMSLKAAVR